MTKVVLYGRDSKYVDVSDRYKGYVPKTDQARTTIFGRDPVPGVKKNVKVIDDGKVEVYEVGEYRLPDKLQELHSKLKLKGGVFDDELDEQVMATLFLERHHRVLEIGADIGTNTCIIASLCDTPPVVVECNNAIESTLRYNVKNNGLNVHLEMGALSKNRLIFRHSTDRYRTASNTIELEDGQFVPDGYGEVRTIHYDDLVKKYHKFDVVVADCEGAFYHIVQDFPQILDDISMLIIENDYKVKGQKEYVDSCLIDKGFVRVYHSTLQWDYNFTYKNEFYEVWKKMDTITIRSSGYNSYYKYSQLGDHIIRSTGLNIGYVNDDGDLVYKNFNTYGRDCSREIIQFHGELMKKRDTFYIVVHDEASHGLNLARLMDHFKKYGVRHLQYLKYRYAYYCVYSQGRVQERLSDIDVKGTVSLTEESRLTLCTVPWRYKYIEDYMDSCNDMLHCNLLISDELDKYDYPDDRMYIFCIHPPNMLYKGTSDHRLHSVFESIPHSKKMLLNIEQMTAARYLSYYIEYVKNDIRLMDYSQFNCDILKQTNMLVPYQYNEDEVNRLRTCLKTVPKKYDVVIVCTLAPRRQHIIDGLKREGITMNKVEGWKENRDEKIAEGHLLLNIHGPKDMLIWESMRCDRWIFSGMPVVSEISADTLALDIKDYVHWSPYDSLVNKVISVLHDIKTGTYVTRTIPDSIIENRKRQLQLFKGTV